MKLLALHGFLGSPSFWRPLQKLWPEPQWLCPDLYLDKEFQEKSWSRFPEQMESWLGRHALEGPFLLMGYSLGGRLALEWARQFPEHFSHLILISSRAGLHPSENPERRLEWQDSWLQKIAREPQSQWLKEWNALDTFQGDRRDVEIPSDLSKQDIIASLKNWSVLEQPYKWEDLAEIHIPSLWAFGTKDKKYSLIAEWTRSHHPKAHLTMIPGAGHRIPLDQPSRLLDAIQSFLKESKDGLYGSQNNG